MTFCHIYQETCIHWIVADSINSLILNTSFWMMVVFTLYFCVWGLSLKALSYMNMGASTQNLWSGLSYMGVSLRIHNKESIKTFSITTLSDVDLPQPGQIPLWWWSRPCSCRTSWTRCPPCAKIHISLCSNHHPQYNIFISIIIIMIELLVTLPIVLSVLFMIST